MASMIRKRGLRYNKFQDILVQIAGRRADKWKKTSPLINLAKPQGLVVASYVKRAVPERSQYRNTGSFGRWATWPFRTCVQ